MNKDSGLSSCSTTNSAWLFDHSSFADFPGALIGRNTLSGMSISDVLHDGSEFQSAVLFAQCPLAFSC